MGRVICHLITQYIMSSKYAIMPSAAHACKTHNGSCMLVVLQHTPLDFQHFGR